MRKTSIFSVIVATLVFTTGCATSSENNTETTVASTAHGPAGGECKVFALAPPPTGELAGSSGTAMGWSGSNKKKSNEPLPSYVEAMLMPVEIGDVESEGGEQHLSSQTVTNVMNDHVNDIFNRCVLKELPKNKMSRIAIQMVVAP